MARVLVISDAPGSDSGFGGQGALLVEAARALGHEVTACAFNVGEVAMPPRVIDSPMGGPMYVVSGQPPVEEFRYVVEAVKPDLILGLADFWMLVGLIELEAYWPKMVLWLTADSEFFPDDAKDWLDAITVVSMSRYGMKAWEKLAKVPPLIPHAVKPSIANALWSLVPRETPAQIRARLGITDHFVALHVGRNQLRKMQPHLIDGWARFVRKLEASAAEKVTLYLHSEPVPAPEQPQDQAGWNLPELIAKFYADVASAIRFSPRRISHEDLRDAYQLCDVHVLVSQAEGFGVPLIEAQANGRANIAADNTTTPELLGDDDEPVRPHGVKLVWSEHGTFGWRVPCSAWMMQPDILERRAVVDPVALAEAFLQTYQAALAGTLNTAELQRDRREWTMARYGWDVVRAQWQTLISEKLS